MAYNKELWTPEVVEYIRENVHNYTIEALTEKLNEVYGSRENRIFSLSAVAGKVRRMGIYKFPTADKLKSKAATVESVKRRLRRMLGDI